MLCLFLFALFTRVRCLLSNAVSLQNQLAKKTIRNLRLLLYSSLLGKWAAVLAFECRGLEPSDWIPGVDFNAISTGKYNCWMFDLSVLMCWKVLYCTGQCLRAVWYVIVFVLLLAWLLFRFSL